MCQPGLGAWGASLGVLLLKNANSGQPGPGNEDFAAQELGAARGRMKEPPTHPDAAGIAPWTRLGDLGHGLETSDTAWTSQPWRGDLGHGLEISTMAWRPPARLGDL